MKSNAAKTAISKKYTFFISHSTHDIDTDVQWICNTFETVKLKCFLADRDAQIGESLPVTVKQAIEESELFLVVLTEYSKKSIWVNQEIGYALGKGIPIIPLKKGDIRVKGLIESAKYIPMGENAAETILDINSKLGSIKISKKAQAAMGILVGILELARENRGVKS